MTLIEHIIARLMEDPVVTVLCGRNPHLDGTDAIVIRDGMLHADDPYSGLVVDLTQQQHEKDLLQRGGLIHATVQVRAISFSKPQSWALRTAVAFSDQAPNSDSRTKGLDGWRDATKGIWGVGLQAEECERLDPADGEDRDIWLVESTYAVDYFEGL